MAQDFVQFAVECGVLALWRIQDQGGAHEPLLLQRRACLTTGQAGAFGEFYAQRLLASGIEFDMVFGPAYKGIPLGAALAVELARRGRNVPFAYNRKEAKDHGEGGTLVGAPLKGGC
jgi:orotate phosphoribosyltransferase